MLDWPDFLINDLARRRAIIVIGSGVSKHAVSADQRRPPVWREFLTQALDRCPGVAPKEHIQEAVANGDLLHACEWLKKRYDETWIPLLREYFSRPKYPPAPIHGLIVRLDSRVVFSLNFDNIYETAANIDGQLAFHVKNYYDADVCEFLGGDGRYIVKVHGNIDSPSKIIFTQNEYARARNEHASFYAAFDAALLTHTFLFVGCGFADPDIALLLENQAFGFPGNFQRPHYFLTSQDMNDDLSESLRSNRNLKVLKYDKIDESHSGLVEELKHLLDHVDEQRQKLSQTTMNW